MDLTDLPFMTEGSTIRNAVVGVVYFFVFISIVGALAGDDPEAVPAGDAEDGTTPTATVTETSDGDGGGGETATVTPTEQPAATPTVTSTPSGPDSNARTSLPSISETESYYDEFATTISGSGQTVTENVTQGGLVVFDYSHSGESNFIVEIYNDNTGERVAIPINQIGAVNGTTAVPLQPAPHSLDVDADGSWEILIARPVSPSSAIHEPPATASGTGPAVVGPIRIEGSVDVTGSHNGQSNFIVQIFNEAAINQFESTLVFNEIGQIENAETRVSHDGVAWVVVKADGEWILEFERP